MLKNQSITQTIIVSAILSVLLGVYGYTTYYGYALDDATYKALQLFTFNESNVPENCIYINISRFLAPLALLSGGIQLIYYIAKNGWTKLCLLFFRQHYIICGYGNTGQAIADKLIRKGKKVIAIDPLLVESTYSLNRIMLAGDATDVNLLMKAKLHKASCVIVVTGSNYINLVVIKNIRSIHTSVKTWIRTEQMLNEYPYNHWGAEPFSLLETLINKLDDLRSENILILGLGNIGHRLIKKYSSNNKTLVIEQSGNTIHMVSEQFENCDIYYERGDVNAISKSDLKKLLESYGLNKDNPLHVFICLGGDWLGFKTAWRWMSWKDIDMKITLFSTSIDEELLHLQNAKTIKVLNIVDDAIAGINY